MAEPLKYYENEADFNVPIAEFLAWIGYNSDTLASDEQDDCRAAVRVVKKFLAEAAVEYDPQDVASEPDGEPYEV